MTRPTIGDFSRFVQANWRTSDKPWETQLAIASLGLAGETGETVEHVKKYLRDGKPLGHMGQDGPAPEVFLELGDVLYYVFVIAGLLGISIEELMELNADKLNNRRIIGGKQPVELISEPDATQIEGARGVLTHYLRTMPLHVAFLHKMRPDALTEQDKERCDLLECAVILDNVLKELGR